MFSCFAFKNVPPIFLSIWFVFKKEIVIDYFLSLFTLPVAISSLVTENFKAFKSIFIEY